MTTPNSGSVPKSDLLATHEDLNGYIRHKEIMLPDRGGTRDIYFSPISNRFFMANERWTVTGKTVLDGVETPVGQDMLFRLFNGNYESYVQVPDGGHFEFEISFDTEYEGAYPGYSYGQFILSFYANYLPSVAPEVRVFTEYQNPDLTWQTLSGVLTAGATSSYINTLSYDCRVYQVEKINVKVLGAPVGSPRGAWINSFEFYNDRPGVNPTPIVSKYKDETLYRRLSWVRNRVVNAFIDEDGSAKFGTIDSPSITAKQDKPTSGTASSSTYLRGDGTWATPTNTTYSVITEAEATAGTATTARTISAATLKGAIQRWATGTYSTAISAIGQALNRAATAADARSAIGAAADSHTHTTAQVTGLDTALAGKASTSHTHTTEQVTGLDAALNSKVAKSGETVEVWSGTQSAYDALPTATKNALGFIAVIR